MILLGTAVLSEQFSWLAMLCRAYVWEEQFWEEEFWEEQLTSKYRKLAAKRPDLNTKSDWRRVVRCVSMDQKVPFKETRPEPNFGAPKDRLGNLTAEATTSRERCRHSVRPRRIQQPDI